MYTEIKENDKKIVQIVTKGEYQHCVGYLDGGNIMLGRLGGEEVVTVSILGLEWDERPDIEDMIEELVEEMGGQEVIDKLGINFIMDTIEQQNKKFKAELLLMLDIEFKNAGHLSIFQELYKNSQFEVTSSNSKLDEFIQQGLEEQWIKFSKVSQPEETPNATRIKKKGYKKNGRKKR